MKHQGRCHCRRIRFEFDGPTWGMPPYGEGREPNGQQMAAVNLRCVDGLDLDAVEGQKFDGRGL